MKPLYTEEQFKDAKSKQELPLECEVCSSVFYKKKHHLQCKKRHAFCSPKCAYKASETLIEKECSWCGEITRRQQNQYKKSKTGNIFCNASCAANHNNRNKSFGTRCSKLEKHLQEELPKHLPGKEIIFNGKNEIGSELDIYFPEHRLAVEINGIHHYEPIYGEEKLKKIQENDKEKKKKCRQMKIDLLEIDTRKQKHFTKESSVEFVEKILEKLNSTPR